jgi:hypothetical protein
MKEETEKPLTDTDTNVTETRSSAAATHANNDGTITPNEAQEPAAKPDQIVLTHNGGPRTQLGKLRSSRNSTKHGIFSAAMLVRGESRSELESLVAPLQEVLSPQGMAEQLLGINWRMKSEQLDIVVASHQIPSGSMDPGLASGLERWRARIRPKTHLARVLRPWNKHTVGSSSSYTNGLAANVVIISGYSNYARRLRAM